MSKSVEDTRRELFKTWFDEQQSIAERCGISLGQSEFDLMESAFNAALDSVEIELPSVYDFHSTSGMKRGCTEAIESLNLGLKIK